MVDALVKAASQRLRPILMTTGAMVLGAVPLALATGAGAESRQQIGWVIVGGMSLGTLLTIFVVPTMYIAVCPRQGARRQQGRGQRAARLPRRRRCGAGRGDSGQVSKVLQRVGVEERQRVSGDVNISFAACWLSSQLRALRPPPSSHGLQAFAQRDMHQAEHRLQAGLALCVTVLCHRGLGAPSRAAAAASLAARSSGNQGASHGTASSQGVVQCCSPASTPAMGPAKSAEASADDRCAPVR
jgi:hypothetical protein